MRSGGWPTGAVTNSLVLFDGHCNLCNATVDVLIRLDRHRRLTYASLQGDTAARVLGGRERSSLPDSVLFWDGRTLHAETDAVFAIARTLGFPYTVVRLLGVLPAGWRKGLYRLVARNRVRWFGTRETCRVPTPAERALFLD